MLGMTIGYYSKKTMELVSKDSCALSESTKHDSFIYSREKYAHSSFQPFCTPPCIHLVSCFIVQLFGSRKLIYKQKCYANNILWYKLPNKKLLIVYGTNFHCNAMTAMKIIETSILRPLLPNKLVGQ
jgi:hypothetical protein